MFIDINSHSINCHGDKICGDTFMQRYIPNQRRTVAVLSDGMGHGIKANILSTLTASIIVNMGQANETIVNIAQTILHTLPVCNIRGISYSTFTIVDINHNTNVVQVIEYDNPQTLVFRSEKQLELERQKIVLENPNSEQRPLQTLFSSTFIATEGDRIILCSDGVTQSGIGTDQYPFGWGLKNLTKYCTDKITSNPTISSNDLTMDVLKNAYQADLSRSKDDITCAAFTFRQSRRLLFCSCPPATEKGFDKLAQNIIDYTGQTIICGYPLAEKISEKLKSPIRKNATSTDPNLPPLWFIDGVDLITEGFLTLTRVIDIMENYEDMTTGRGPAYRIIKMMLNSDHIQMVIGTKESTTDGQQFIDNFQLRRKLIERVSFLLETQFAKAVSKTYI